MLSRNQIAVAVEVANLIEDAQDRNRLAFEIFPADPADIDWDEEVTEEDWDAEAGAAIAGVACAVYL